MRVLHTGDWHLGATTGGVSRAPDFARFFEWLRAAVTEHAVDVLVVAGDVFEHAEPSAEALTLWYDALSALVGTRLQAVVVVGGNHDSASRLDAPRDLLARLCVHVVGGLPSGVLDLGDAALGRALVRVGDLVVLAVPYVHEYRLGVRRSATSEGDAPDIRQALADAFRRLYRRLADLAEARWPGLPLIATGHLVAVGARPGDWGMHIHQVGLLGALPADLFDPRLAYVALGHLHRSFEVAPERGRPVWYCGSPVALTAEEARTPRRALLVDVDGPHPARAADRPPARVTPLEIPHFRDILSLSGTPEEMTAALAALRSHAPLPPLIQVEAKVEGWQPALEKGLAAALDAAGIGARLVSLRQVAPDGEGAASAEAPAPRAPSRLADLDPEAVFLRLAALRGEPVDEALLSTFRGLVHAERDPEASG